MQAVISSELINLEKTIFKPENETTIFGRNGHL